jgi:cytochrome c oxidase assembly protein subunit 15
MADSSRAFHILVAVTFALMTAVVLLSAYMRLSATGLGCDGWPACYGNILAGHAPPRPEWINVSHRIAASAMGLAVLAIAMLAWQRRRAAPQDLPLALALFGLTAFLATLGRWTHDARLPAVALGNLLGGLGMLLLLWRLHLGYARHTAAPSSLRGWVAAGLALAAAQTALGGMASANFATSICPGLAGCEGWLAHADLAAFNPLAPLEAPKDGSFTPGARQQTLHMAHRLFALPVIAYAGWLGIRLLKTKQQGGGTLLLTTLILLLALGVGAVLGGSPLFAVLLHNAAAALLLLILLTVWHRIRRT